MNSISKHGRLAQRLLCMLMPMLACGCLWPTSLTDAVSDNTNVRPVLVGADPDFGIINRSAGQSTSLQVTVEDPTPGIMLTARLFTPGSSGPESRIWTGQSIDAFTKVSGTANTYTGSFYTIGVDLCGNFPNMQELFVVVSDESFSNQAGFQNQSTGLTDENHWQLVCQ